jgi:hypothetical protein
VAINSNREGKQTLVTITSAASCLFWHISAMRDGRTVQSDSVLTGALAIRDTNAFKATAKFRKRLETVLGFAMIPGEAGGLLKKGTSTRFTFADSTLPNRGHFWSK